MNILVQSVFGRFSKHFYEKHGKDQVYSLISLLKEILNLKKIRFYFENRKNQLLDISIVRYPYRYVFIHKF